MNYIDVYSGQIGFSKDGEVFRVTLGSCVSVCIYDSKLKIGGLTHFLLPHKTDGIASLKVTENPKNFAEESIVSLLRKFKQAGSNKKDLKIYLLGGGEGANSGSIGNENVIYARKTLSEFGLEVAKEKTGVFDLVFKFDSKSGEISILRRTIEKNLDNESKRSDIGQGSSIEKKIKVLVVDDSSAMTKIIKAKLSEMKNFEVVGVALDALEAEKLRKKLNPDVMTLDLNMPIKDGVTYLTEIMSVNPLPVVIVSELGLKEASPVMRALELGAFDYLEKPSLREIDVFAESLAEKLTAGFESRHKIAKASKESSVIRFSSKTRKDKGAALPIDNFDKSVKLIAIGSSTGGTEAIKNILVDFPDSTPPIIIIQHIPKMFSATFAEGLNKICNISVKEAIDREEIKSNTAYVAPGGKQLKLKEIDRKFFICITDDPPVNRFKPSVDYFFESIAKTSIAKSTKAVLLTGMGEDGARGMLALKNAGAMTIAQNEASCVVYGMPKAAVKLNAVQKVLHLSEIGYHLLSKAS